MSTIQSNVQQAVPQSGVFLFDEDGFLLDAATWSQEAAQIIADMDDVGALSDQHWKVINYIRERFFAVGGVPAMRTVCKASGLDRDEIKQMFGSCCEVWRLAGLPNPGEEARAYMS
jgi:tRNA 2-thiouridine synthesizing protein E